MAFDIIYRVPQKNKVIRHKQIVSILTITYSNKGDIMNQLEDCKTVKQCLFWAESTWPGFWDFATLAPMTTEEVTSLVFTIEGDPIFVDFLTKFEQVATSDNSPEAIELLIKGSKAFARMGEIKHDKRTNTKG